MERKILPLHWLDVLKDMDIASVDNEFALLDAPLFIAPAFDHPFKSDATVAIICTKGEMRGRMNIREYVSVAPCLFIVLAGQILQYDYMSDDFEGYFIIMSKRFTDNLLLNAHDKFPMKLAVDNNPSIPLNAESVEALLMYYGMMKRILELDKHPYRLETIRHLTLAFFYGAGHYFHDRETDTKKPRQEILVEDFFELLQAHYKVCRGLEFYAGKLFLTPKYLSKVVKEMSGKSASKWIDDYVIMEAKALLKSTNMTVQQVGDELNFPSQSFFGKYFKRIVGISPKEYKKN